MKIGNIIIDRKIFITLLIIFVVVTGLVGYSYLNSDLSFALAINVDDKVCVQENLNDRLRCLSTPDNMRSKYVSSSTGIDFSNISSDTNGKGIYTLSSTIGTTYPVSYYRGAVTDNNVKFGGYCWKIVRTTDTGGTKLIYNGVPDGSGHCSATGTDTKVEDSKIYNSNEDLPRIGYMYGTNYASNRSELDNTYLFGSSISYEQRTGDSQYYYYLNDTVSDTSLIGTHHYYCNDKSNKCSSVRYIYYYYNSTSKYYYYTFSNGQTLTTFFDSMKTDENNSLLKASIDGWYTSNFSSNASFLEDTIWCSDRKMNTLGSESYTLNGFNPSGNNIYNNIYYGGYGRIMLVYTPSLICDDLADSYTVSNSIGNGKLINKLATLTADEVMLAGGKDDTISTFYLNSGDDWWTLTPAGYRIPPSDSYSFYVSNDGKIKNIEVNESFGVRPSVSLRHEVVITGGDGSSDNPYTIDLPFTPSQVSYAKPGSFTTTYDSSTLSMNVDLTTSAGWEYIIKPLSVKKGKNYRISLDYTISNDYTGYSSFSGIGLQVVDSSLSYITTANDATGPLNEVRITNNRYLSNTAGTYSETIDFTAGEENYFIINCGMAGDSQTINFKISNFYIREI